MDLSLSRHQRRFGAALRSEPTKATDGCPLRTAKMGDGEKAARATKCCSRFALRRPGCLPERRGTARLSARKKILVYQILMCGGGKEIRNSRLESCNPRKSRDNIVPHRPVRSVSQTSCQAISPYRENSVPGNRSVPGLPSLVDRSPPAIACMMRRRSGYSVLPK